MAEQSERLHGKSKGYFDIALRGIGENARKQYTSKLLEFLEWADLDSQTMFDQHKANLKAEDADERKQIPLLVSNFQHYRVDEKGDKPASTRLIVKAVKKLFEYPEIHFSMNSFKIRVEEGKAVKPIPLISKPQLVQVLGVCGSIRMTAVIHVARDTGLRISDICRIKVEHIQPLLDGEDFTTFETLPIKNRQKDNPLYANPVIGPDCAEPLRMWMRRREELGIESDWLFTCVKNVKAHVNKKGLKHKATKKGERLHESTAGVIFRGLRDKAGLRPTKISIHSLRVYNTTRLFSADLQESWINKLQGRRGTGTFGRYHRPDPEELIERYSKAYHGLQLVEKQNAKVKDLEAQVAELMKYKQREDEERARILKYFEEAKARESDMVEVAPGEWVSREIYEKRKAKEA